MYNEINKMLLGAVLLPLIASCGGSAAREQALALYDQAETALNENRYELALTLTDSIKNACPDQIEIRRKALHIAARANEGLILHRLEQADSVLAFTAAVGDSLSRLVKKVDNPIEPYYICASVDPASLHGSTGLQARMSPDGDLYIISSLTGRQLKSTSVSVSDGSASASTATVACDGERNDRSMGAEVITFMGVECDSLAHFISLNRDRALTLTFHGATDYSMPLPTAQVQAIATMRDYSATLRRARIASLEKERLTKALDIARSQAARTYVEKQDEKQ